MVSSVNTGAGTSFSVTALSSETAPSSAFLFAVSSAVEVGAADTSSVEVGVDTSAPSPGGVEGEGAWSPVSPCSTFSASPGLVSILNRSLKNQSIVRELWFGEHLKVNTYIDINILAKFLVVRLSR